MSAVILEALKEIDKGIYSHRMTVRDIQRAVRDIITLAEAEKTDTNTVALLQVPANPGWLVVSVHETKGLAEIEASLRGYTEWSVAEFGIRGRE